MPRRRIGATRARKKVPVLQPVKILYRCKFLLTGSPQAIFMKILIGAAAGWIIFYAVDLALFDGRLVAGVPQLATAILNGFGFYF
jgi:hypothetical protein